MENKRKKHKMNAVRILALGFLGVICMGGILLSLPISSVSGEFTNFLDSFFTSTSAVCVTGLVTLDTWTHWSTFGQVVILLLIETGALGFMSIATFAAILFGKKISLRERLVMQESMNAFNIQGLVKMVQYVVGFTLLIQCIGAVVLSTQFIPQHGIGKGIYFSVFHAVSAFCNAGFDLNGNFVSLVPYAGNWVILLTLSALIIVGGLGFAVILELYNYKKIRRISTHGKLVLLVTAILIFGGTLVMFLLEYKNPNTIGPMRIGDKIVNSFFAAVTPRTAGFNSISTDKMTTAGAFMTILLMFVGGSPGSTAGGIKTTTLGIAIVTVICIIRGRENTEAFGRRFSKELVYRTFALLMIGVTLVMVVTMILSITESGETFLSLLYEATSAFGTVGLSTGVTQRLSSIGKIIIMITMYCGRVGPLTVLLALAHNKKRNGYKYPEGKILIG
ncbi:TrkH family potassium uptake protein [Clostridium vincentii]|uniref:Potassium/sodium uptake protein NtpJ n=1 Tax=Clostridium vincentii TaxID=52704 RepID=A0A2T0BG75_9CLOT|nr:TrkH family potassium uptake protein [Clostridium vincentii]PRR82895.1 Potassium/sodium uptake protein NtpJ [Clostridium vincentii]